MGIVPAAGVDTTIGDLLASVVFHPLPPPMIRRGVAIAVETGRSAAYNAQHVALQE